MDTNNPTLVMIALGFVIVAVTKILSDNRTRRKVLEARVSDETARALFAPRDPDAWGALKWGMVLAGVGVAFIVIQLGGFSAGEPITYGLVFLFAGGGLLGYHRLARAAGRWDPELPHASDRAPAPPRDEI
ncbi:MAG TPA: hypothetical protein VHG91_13895 [Longimicrobium sp.]|nr:hypothetical protein [Longimicrobium sp.]